MASYDASIRVHTKIDNSDIKYAKEEVERLGKKLDEVATKRTKVEKKLRADVDRQSSKTLKSIDAEYRAIENELRQAQVRLEQLQLASDASGGFDKANASAKKLYKTVESGQKKANSDLRNMSKMMVRMMAQMLLFRTISATLKFVGAGIQNLSQYSERLNSVLSDMKSESAMLKNSLAAAFEPVATMIIPYITTLISWLNTAMNYLTQFWAALSGKSTYTRAKKQVVDYAKSLKDASGSAKGALAAFDEINVLNKDTGSSSGGEVTGIEAFEEAEVSGFSWIEKMKESLSGLVDYFIQPFIENRDKFEEALNGFLDASKIVWESIKSAANSTFEKFTEVYKLHFKPFLDSIILGFSVLVGAFMDFWNTYAQPVLDNLAVKFDEVLNEHIQPMIDRFLELLGSVANALLVFWEEAAKPLIKWIIDNVLPVLMPIFESIAIGIFDLFAFVADIFENLIGILKGVIDFIVSVFTGDWAGAWNSIKDIIDNAVDIMASIIGMGFATIENIIKTVLDIIYGVVSVIFNGICDFVGWIMKRLDAIISGMLGGIKTKWLDAWNGMKNGIVNVFKIIRSTIQFIVNSIIGTIEKMVNSIINGVNAAIDALNGMGFDIPDWVPIIGGASFHLNISRLDEVSMPRLATGGIVTSSTIANIGEAGREAVLPLDNNTEWAYTLADVLGDKIGSNRPVVIRFEGSLAELGRVLKPVIDSENGRVGVSLAQN